MQGHSAAYGQCEVKLKYKRDLQNMFNDQSRTRHAEHNDGQNYQYEGHSTLDYPPLRPRFSHPLDTPHRPYKPPQNHQRNPTPTRRRYPSPSQQDQPDPWTHSQDFESLLTIDESLELINLFTAELLKCRTIQQQIHTIAKLSLHSIQKIQSRRRSP